MEDTVKIKLALNLSSMIDDHKGADTVVIDISKQNSWTDYFIITTISSIGHLKGLIKHINTFIAENNLTNYHKHKQITDEKWVLIDCGFMIIHLMNKEAREFYDLEKLWFSGDILNQSSKSS